ncbi:rod-binding protein [Treponema pectinovorum]|uniref:rod-binding protein n=1 Tax=Treponema pectinovorum TaxID=164 RepID=UPI002090A43C|nr:rod-binding protein [Treponema pectinovorum]
MMTIGGISSITNGQAALTSAKISEEKGKFEELIRSVYGESSSIGLNLASDQVLSEGRLNGDYKSDFSGTFSSPSDKNSMPVGAAANQANPNVKPRTIDRTSKLYEKSLEMESYIVKMMISQMRKTVVKASGESDFASKMYEDMLYDEYATAMTKKAGFGLADQMYLQLTSNGINIEA